jgi:adenine-specific DNA-methyltransferase
MTKLEELIVKLSELFELDKADLDFGIHRIIKSKHVQVRDYLENRLPNTVETHLGELAAGESASQLEDLHQEVIGSFGSDAIDEAGEINEAYARTPLGEKYQLIRESSSGSQASGNVENEVYSHLLEFFSRYYEDADFMSLRRRTAGRESYAIPFCFTTFFGYSSNETEITTLKIRNTIDEACVVYLMSC